MPTLRERIENNLPIFFLATLATGFVAGFGALRAIQQASDSLPVPRAAYEQLQKDAAALKQHQQDSASSMPAPSSATANSATTAIDDGPIGTQTPPPQQPSKRALDGAVAVISGDSCWDYRAEPISIGGKFFNDYAVISYGCNGDEALTFDIRGWEKFEGSFGIVRNDARSNKLTIKSDQNTNEAVELNYKFPPRVITIPLADRSTLTFQKDNRYPEVVVGEPRLIKN